MYLELFKKIKNTTINNKICNHRYYCSHLKLLFFFISINDHRKTILIPGIRILNPHGIE